MAKRVGSRARNRTVTIKETVDRRTFGERWLQVFGDAVDKFEAEFIAMIGKDKALKLETWRNSKKTYHVLHSRSENGECLMFVREDDGKDYFHLLKQSLNEKNTYFFHHKTHNLSLDVLKDVHSGVVEALEAHIALSLLD